MNKLTKKSFFSLSIGENSSPEVSFSPKKQPVSYEVFKEHWKQALKIFNKSLVNDDDIQIVKNNLNQMINLLIDELNHPNNYLSLKPLAFNSLNSTLKVPENTDYGPIWNYLFRHNIFEVVFLWSLSYPEYLFDLKLEQLKYYENLVYQMQTNEQTHLLLNFQIHRPLFALLNHCSTHNSEQIEKIMISILNQLCVCICKNSDLLEIFFQQAKMVSNQVNNSNSSTFYLNENGDSPNNPYKFTTHFSTNKQYMQPVSTAKFFIFSLLIPYIHKEGALGQQARDALLMIMQLSMRNFNLAKYIVDNTDFCPILATGLSGLYSELPQKLESGDNFDEIRYLKKEDILRIPSLNKFINSLEFCNNVIQVSHSLIANQLLQYVYYGFLVPVIAPALTQNCVDEIIAATAYVDLFLRTIIEPNLLKVFLKFILHAKFDEKITLLDTLISRINSNTKLSLITLMLFYTMIDFNSEEVIYKLILVYLIPCNHIMKSQLLTLKQSSNEINGINTNTFLTMATSYDKPVWLEPISKNVSNNIGLTSILNKNKPTPFVKWFHSLFEQNEMSNIASYLDGSQFNFIDYLKDAQQGILMTTQSSLKWSSFYDTSSCYSDSSSIVNSDSSQTPFTKLGNNDINKAPSHELDYDAEEYLLNLNIFTTTINDPIKSTRDTQNIFESNTDEINDYDSTSQCFKRESSVSSDVVKIYDKLKKTKKKSKKLTRYKTEIGFVSLGGIKDSTLDKENFENLTVPKADATKKRQRMRQRRRERANDFYFLSFDNELSESDSSMTSDNEEPTKPIEKKYESQSKVIIHETEDCENLTGTSYSSSMTLNNETSSISSNQNQDDSGSLNPEYRQQLIEYLFSNEENKNSFLNGNLTNFMEVLDAFFAQNEKPFVYDKKTNDLNSTCDHILGFYNQLFTTQSKSIESTNMSKYEDKSESQIDNTNSVTHLPGLVNSAHSSNHSLNAHFDSGCVIDSSKIYNFNNSNDTSKEIDTGPFLVALFGRLDHMLSNSLEINFLLTGILARLAYYPQLLLRSFLLNHNLVVQPNIKTLIQVLNNVKYKIDACSQSFNNFPLLYFKAKVCLVKRIVESKPNEPTNDKNNPKEVQEKQKSETKFRDIVRKRSTFDRFINFFKSEEPVVVFEKEEEHASNKIQQEEYKEETSIDLQESNKVHITVSENSKMPQVEYDLNDVKMMFSKNDNSKKNESISLKNVTIHDDYSLLDNEWENIETRNIAYSAVIFDEFIKELAAICQEHGLTTHVF